MLYALVRVGGVFQVSGWGALDGVCYLVTGFILEGFAWGGLFGGFVWCLSRNYL